ncbi:MAG TPA: alpha/beta hydrolase [Roseiflexaceae bacterium]|nr:alpha/beta hydrolase [Roseiflexaceae bacterium]
MTPTWAIPLWPGAAPGALGRHAHDRPSITPYLPAQPTGAALLICPGGGYRSLAAHEGHDYALWLTSLGITCFVLRYRLGSDGYRHPCMQQDVTRAMRLVRASAAHWQIDPARIGVIGSSAGGHLAATLLTHCDHGDLHAADPIERASSRPDLGILCYPVISLGSIAHQGSRQNLLGDAPSNAQIAALSLELHVASHTPPCFLWHTWADEKVGVAHSLLFATALQQHGVPFELHIYQHGHHGIGLGDVAPFTRPHPWLAALQAWLRIRHFLAEEAG